MNTHRLMHRVILAFLIMSSFQARSNDISATAAHAIANDFIKHHVTKSPGSLKAPSAADIKLVHAEPSSKVLGSNVYYAFNIEGGGFIIVAGDDRASQVLGYSEKGQIDFNHLAAPMRDLLNLYKFDIEYLQTHRLDNTQLGKRQCLKDASAGVEPMTTSIWGQEHPYYLQCPVYNNEYSKVGCVGVCMAQMLYFWKYPLSCGSYPAYYNNKTYTAVPSLPATTFDYTKMHDALCHWDWDISETVQDIFDEAQVQEVAKLCRYVGQASRMQYSPSMSITRGSNKFNAMLGFGYNPNADSVSFNNYPLDVWEGMMRNELDAGRPIMYSGFSRDGVAVGHAFIVDGYNNEGFFHINMGWYGTNDGWYVITAISLINRYGEHLEYTNRVDMFINMEPPTFFKIQTGDIDANTDMIVLGENLYPQANDVFMFTSHRVVDLMFTLTDSNGATAAIGEPQRVIRHRFEQGCDISLPLTLPTNLAPGTYDLNFSYSTADDVNSIINAETAPGKLVVVGRLAKFNADFDISDITLAINYLLDESTILDITDVTELIEYVLNQNS